MKIGSIFKALIVVEEHADSCGRSETGETKAHRSPRGKRSVLERRSTLFSGRRLTARPRKASALERRSPYFQGSIYKKMKSLEITEERFGAINYMLFRLNPYVISILNDFVVEKLTKQFYNND
jgi:hypothetical protein